MINGCSVTVVWALVLFGDIIFFFSFIFILEIYFNFKKKILIVELIFDFVTSGLWAETRQGVSQSNLLFIMAFITHRYCVSILLREL